MKITLCGSTRFREAYERWNRDLGLAEHIVYSLSCFGAEAGDKGKEGNTPLSEAEKVTLDLVHLRKIMESDAVVVINPSSTEFPFGYIGSSTKKEIQWAHMLGKAVYSVNPLQYGFLNSQKALSAHSIV